MLHTKFHENRPAGSGEEDFWRVFTIYGHGGHLGHVTQMPRTKYRSPYPRRLHIKFGFDRASGFWEEDVWALWTDDGRTTDDVRRTPDHGYTISSPMSLRLRWANKFIFKKSKNWPLKPSYVVPLNIPEDQWSCKRSPDILAYISKAQNIQNLENIW